MAFMLEQKVAVKEMEAAAIAWVAALFHIPMFSLKSITDIVDGTSLRHKPNCLASHLHAHVYDSLLISLTGFASR